MVEGVTNGFSKTLELVGVGYRAQKKGNKVVLNVGYSHPVEVDPHGWDRAGSAFPDPNRGERD